jgi:hypothetical protein
MGMEWEWEEWKEGRTMISQADWLRDCLTGYYRVVGAISLSLEGFIWIWQRQL